MIRRQAWVPLASKSSKANVLLGRFWVSLPPLLLLFLLESVGIVCCKVLRIDLSCRVERRPERILVQDGLACQRAKWGVHGLSNDGNKRNGWLQTRASSSRSSGKRLLDGFVPCDFKKEEVREKVVSGLLECIRIKNRLHPSFFM